MCKTLLCSGAAGLVVISCLGLVAADDVVPEGLITKPGDYKLHDKLFVIVRDNGALTWSVYDGRKLSGSGVNKRDRLLPWFIFAPSADVVWCYGGDDKLRVIDFRKDGDFGRQVMLPATWPDKLIGSPPQEVIDRLPAKLPAKNAAENAANDDPKIPADQLETITFLGVGLVDAPGDGVVEVRVNRVVHGSPAAESGIQEGDSIIKFDGSSVTGKEQLTQLIRSHKRGERVHVTVQRQPHGQGEWRIPVVLGETKIKQQP